MIRPSPHGARVVGHSPRSSRVACCDVTRPLRLASFVEADQDRIVGLLLAWLRIPSISAHETHAGDVEDSARFLAGMCHDLGLENVEIIATAGHPAVYADWLHAPAAAPTVLVYGHHDVQPVDPENQWTSPPFEPVIVDGECRARGAIDDKGQVLYQLEALRGLLRDHGGLPVNVKVLIEGEEEIGSPNFEALLAQRGEQFGCDVVVVSDTGMLGPDLPSTDISMRGLIAFTVTLTTGPADLHSGLFGGAVPNPIHHLARLVTALHDAHGRIAITGFYDDVAELSERAARSLEVQPFDEQEFREVAGVAFLEGEAGRSTLERIGSRPTAEVVGITGGYGGSGIKTIVPATATAKITFRLVPNQDPTRLSTLIEAWIRAQVPRGISVVIEPHGGVAPALTPIDHWSFEALTNAICRVWGSEPLLTRVGGSGPEEALGRVLDAPVLFLGVGLPGDRIHSPNERMVMDQFWQGLLAAGELFHDLAETAPSPSRDPT